MALALFGFVTLILSSSIILDLFNVREKEGNYVLFIVWANFICSIIYLISAFAIFRRNTIAFKLLLSSLIILIIAFVAFVIYINSGGIHETKTIYAMIFRMSITLLFTVITYFTINKKTTL